MEKQKVIFFTGAGISVESGIPTFQEQPGIREKLHRDFANNNPEEYKETLRTMIETCENAKPNAAHKAIAATGFPVITMNIDGLHHKAGSLNVTEVHGTLPTKDQLNKDDFILYDKLVLYGDIAPQYETAYKMVKSLEYNNSYFVVVGTSFYTNISNELLKLAKSRKANIAIINENACERVPVVCRNLSTLAK